MENNKLSNLYFNKIMKHIDKLAKEMDLYYKFKNNIILSQSGGSNIADRYPFHKMPYRSVDLLTKITGKIKCDYNDVKITCVKSYIEFLENYKLQQLSTIYVTHLEILDLTINRIIEIVNTKVEDLLNTYKGAGSIDQVKQRNLETNIKLIEPIMEKLHINLSNIITKKMSYNKDESLTTNSYENYINDLEKVDIYNEINDPIVFQGIEETISIKELVEKAISTLVISIHDHMTQSNTSISDIIDDNDIKGVSNTLQVQSNNSVGYIVNNQENYKIIVLHLLGLIPHQIIYKMEFTDENVKYKDQYDKDTGILKTPISINDEDADKFLDNYKKLVEDIIKNYDTYVTYLYHIRNKLRIYEVTK